MAEQLQPEGMSRLLNDMDRRLRNLENTARVGLSRAKFVRQFGAVAPTTFGMVWESGPAGSDWVDDTGATGAGYATLTVPDMGKRAAIFMGCTIGSVLTAATFRSDSAMAGVGIDGNNPQLVPNYPVMYRRFFPGTTQYTEVPFTFFCLRNDFTPGTHVFKVWAAWANTNPAAINQPLLNDAFLLVIPIDQ